MKYATALARDNRPTLLVSSVTMDDPETLAPEPLTLIAVEFVGGRPPADPAVWEGEPPLSFGLRAVDPSTGGRVVVLCGSDDEFDLLLAQGRELLSKHRNGA